MLKDPISPIWITQDTDFAGTAVVNWIDQAPDNFYGYGYGYSYSYGIDLDYFSVFQDGLYIGQTQQETMVVSGLRNGASYRFEVLKQGGIEASLYNSEITEFVCNRIGNRLRLSWPQIDLAANPDFYSYVLYWNEGSGNEADTLLADNLIGINYNVFETGELEDGLTYIFGISFKDIHGNESVIGSRAFGFVQTLPEPVTDVDYTYSSVTRKATITATAPVDQDADVVLYAYYSNYLPAYGLQPAINLERRYRLTEIPIGDTITYTTYELSEGLWFFCIRATDNQGNESEYETVKLNLVLDGYTLIEKPVPAIAQILDARAIAAGAIEIDIRINEATGDYINIYLDEIKYDSIAIEADTLEYSYTTGTLTNGHEYKIQVNGQDDTTESELSDPVYVTADSEPPSGSQIITVELIQ